MFSLLYKNNLMCWGLFSFLGINAEARVKKVFPFFLIKKARIIFQQYEVLWHDLFLPRRYCKLVNFFGIPTLLRLPFS